MRCPGPGEGLSGSSVSALTASWGNAGALLRDGKYYNWGFDEEGQLGNGTTNQSATVPVQVTLPGPVTQAAQGGSFASNGQTLVKLADGSLYAWGDDSYGQLGNGTTGVEPSPVQFRPPAGVTYQTLASGGATSYAITTTGDVYAWGQNSGPVSGPAPGGQTVRGTMTGMVGDGTTKTAMTPVMVKSGATHISSTAANVAASSR